MKRITLFGAGNWMYGMSVGVVGTVVAIEIAGWTTRMSLGGEGSEELSSQNAKTDAVNLVN